MVFESVFFQQRAHRIHNLSRAGKTLDALNELKRTAADISDTSIHLTAPPTRRSLHQDWQKGRAVPREKIVSLICAIVSRQPAPDQRPCGAEVRSALRAGALGNGR